MNKNVLNIIVSMILFCSCSSDEPYQMPLDEFPPIKLSFILVNERGEDLLNPENPDNVLNEEIFISYKENEYILNSSFEVNPNGDESPADFKGLRLSTYQDKYVLSFGELDGSYYYKDESMSLKLYTHDHRYVLATRIEFYSIWTYDENGYPDFYRYYKRGGKILELENSETATPVIKIVCEASQYI